MHPDTLEVIKYNFYNKITEKIIAHDPITNQNNINVRIITLRYHLFKDVREAFIWTLDKEIQEYWENNPTELSQRQKEWLIDIADVLGLKNAWEGLWAIALTIKATIEDDPELMALADKELREALNDIVKQDLNPVARLQKIKKVYNFVQKGKKVKYLHIWWKKIDADHFHKNIKPNILKKSWKFDWKVGKNPDINVKNGEIILVWTEHRFKKQSYSTGLKFKDFID